MASLYRIVSVIMILSLIKSGLFANRVMVNGAELVHAGDRLKTGSIVYFPQNHKLFDDLFDEYNDEKEFCRNVAEDQFRILKGLREWGARKIFSECHL